MPIKKKYEKSLILLLLCPKKKEKKTKIYIVFLYPGGYK